MGLPTNIHQSHLRDMHLRSIRGLPVDVEHIEAMIEVLTTLLDEAQDAEEEHGSIDDLVGIIPRLEKLRVEAVEQKDELEREKDEEIETFKKERSELVDEHEKTIADMREAHEQEIAKIREDYEADFARQQVNVTEANAARVLVETKIAEMKASDPFAALSALASTSSLLDTGAATGKISAAIRADYRRARDRALQILQGRPQPMPENIPTRSARRKKGT